MIVESPAKARTISAYLGDDFVVDSSVGHIRDLPTSAKEIPDKFKKEPWARLGVDVEHDFEPLYVVDSDKKSKVSELRKRLANAEELLLATDEDREGEAIAWHLIEVLKPKVPVRRMVFHEITRPAIERALEQTRQIDVRLVDAQETRRILDRLYGYEVSPVLWRKITSGLSRRPRPVGRDAPGGRARARADGVRPAPPGGTSTATFGAPGVEIPGRSAPAGGPGRPAWPRAATSAATARLEDRRCVLLDEAGARGLAERLDGVGFTVKSVERKPYLRRPSAPFMTSTLQQEASRKLRFTSQRTMQVAQRLYENGYITYMRTDSTTLSDSALTAARAQARELYGPEYVPDQPRRYDRKVKNAQEAHEAIRPAGDAFRTPDQVSRELGSDELRLYDLIWSGRWGRRWPTPRARPCPCASSAPPPRTRRRSSARPAPSSPSADSWPRTRRAATTAARGRGAKAPNLSEGDALTATALEPQGHETTPPPRYTEATLVRALEERGIGRPSTYAAIIGTILDRGYVFKKDSALVPTFLAFAVVGLLEQHFGRLVDYDFTARMEDDLDRIAAGDEERVEWLRRFYYGNGAEGLKDLVSDLGGIDAREVSSIEIGDGIVVRVGRYGPYLEREAAARASRHRSSPTSSPWRRRRSCSRSPRRTARSAPTPRQASRSSRARAATARTYGGAGGRLEGEAAHRLAVPEHVARHDHARGRAQAADRPACARRRFRRRRGGRRPERPLRPVRPEGQGVALAGLARSSCSRSRSSRRSSCPLETEGARTPRRSRRAAAELGDDPETQKPVVVKDGRFGPYVTDGEVNATIRGADTPDTISLERASELLAERRAKGPAKPRKQRARARDRRGQTFSHVKRPVGRGVNRFAVCDGIRGAGVSFDVLWRPHVGTVLHGSSRRVCLECERRMFKPPN